MNPLEAALRPVANLLNRNIRATTPAREICRALAGTTIAVRVRDTALAAYFHVHEDALELAVDSDDEPDVLISGSLLTLARMAGAPGTEALRQGSLDIAGDVQLAGDFQKLLALAKPDLEEELSGIVGDVAAHRLGELAFIGVLGGEKQEADGDHHDQDDAGAEADEHRAVGLALSVFLA
jgi:ubiquinone biosynthesis protein UbiJ